MIKGVTRYSQVVRLPIIFQVDEAIIGKVPEYLKEHEFTFSKILVVSGVTVSFEFAQVVLKGLNASSYTVDRDDTEAVETLAEHCLINEIELLIGVGGGHIMDIVKRVSLLNSIENILVPTIISNDGLTSPISVVVGKDGKSHSLPGKMPLGIVVDLDVIRSAPNKFLQSAAGDILSNISATNDWVLAHRINNEKINDLAYILSRNAAFALLHHETKDLRNKSFLKQVINCQINSGLAMALAGTSRPCSGSEHLISHAIDFKSFSANTLHGYQVGSISIFCLYLQKRLDAKCIDYAHQINLPLAFHKLNNKIYDHLQLIFETSFLMRPGRFTVLDTCKGKPFSELYDGFLDFLDRFKS
jgi:glycerol-1-phosphate dehydrogenase [NAD(P)+]